MRALRSWLPLVLASVACGAAAEETPLIFAPGISGRMALAMRYGSAAPNGLPRPAEVRRALAPELLPQGSAASGRLGDWVLENGVVAIVITDVDGSARGGRLVDVTFRGAAAADELTAFEIEVMGSPVRNVSMTSGFDVPTGAAYVQVTGHPRDLPGVEVSTRYDVNADVAGVLVHTQVRGFDAALAAEAPVLTDELQGGVDPAPLRRPARPLAAGAEAEVSPARIGGAPGDPDEDACLGWFGQRSGYLLRPLGVELRDARRAPRALAASYWADDDARSSALYLVSRLVAPLERPDTASLAVAHARANGRDVGDVEIRLAGGRAAIDGGGRGALTFARADGSLLEALGIMPRGVPLAYSVSLPVGRYIVAFDGATLVARRSAVVDVRRDQLSTVELPVATRSATAGTR